jgi:hypothetical protein
MRARLCTLAVLVTLLLLATAPPGAQTRDKPNRKFNAETDIIFPIKFYFEERDLIQIQGTLTIQGTPTGDWIQYPNNTYTVKCTQHLCIAASVRQIDSFQTGGIGIQTFIVTEWSNSLVIAHDEDGECIRTTITIDRSAKTLLWVVADINQGTALCKKLEHLPPPFGPIITPLRATIEDPVFWQGH